MPKTTQSNEFGQQALASANFAARINDDRNLGGAVQFASIVVNFDGTPMANLDVVSLIRLPAGAFVMPELSQVLVLSDLTAGALNVAIGDVLDPYRYALSVDVADRGQKTFISPTSISFPIGLTTRRKVDDTGVPATDTSVIIMTMVNGPTSSAGTFIVTLAYKTL